MGTNRCTKKKQVDGSFIQPIDGIVRCFISPPPEHCHRRRLKAVSATTFYDCIFAIKLTTDTRYTYVHNYMLHTYGIAEMFIDERKKCCFQITVLYTTSILAFATIFISDD